MRWNRPNPSSVADISPPREPPNKDDRPIVEERTARNVARSTADECLRASTGSAVIDEDKEEELPHLSRHELTLGRMLGRGGFNDVYEIRQIDLREDDDPAVSSHDSSTGSSSFLDLDVLGRRFLVKHCIRKQCGSCRYAAKFLRRDVLSDADKFDVGAKDLAREAALLANLVHPNIIKIRAMTEGGVGQFATGLACGYFLVLDRLHDTLAERIEGAWKAEKKQIFGGKFHRVLHVTPNKTSIEKQRDFLARRLHVAFDIAGALKYLHSRNIIHRDIKPENMGFDIRGDIKLFDLGLTTELRPEESLADGTYKLSAMTGTLRYMAPEVAKAKTYNLSADVYSFAVVLWEIMSLKKPLKSMSRRDFLDQVVYGSYRPPIDPLWPEPMKTLLSHGWGEDVGRRPNIDSIYWALRKEVAMLRDGDYRRLSHSRRRSTSVFEDIFMSRHSSRSSGYSPNRSLLRLKRASEQRDLHIEQHNGCAVMPSRPQESVRFSFKKLPQSGQLQKIYEL